MGEGRRHEVEARLARIEGHLHAVHRMAHEEKPYPEVVHQVVAVRASLDAVLKVIIDDLADEFGQTSPRDAALQPRLAALREAVSSAL